MSKSIKSRRASLKASVSRPAASVGAASLLQRSSKQTNETPIDNDKPIDVSITGNGLALVEQRAKDFAATWSDDTNAALSDLWDAKERVQRSVPEIMYDLRADFFAQANYSEQQIEAATATDKALEPMALLPKPYSEAPKGMTPSLWPKTSNKPWPFDMWREKKSQTQGGERNVNQVFYLVAFDKSDAGRKLLDQITEVKDQIARSTSATPQPLTGDYQGMEIDELQGLKGKLESRRNTAGNAIRNAVALHLQLAAFESLSDHCEFSILAETVTDESGKTYQRPHSNKKHVRFGIVKVLERNKDGSVKRQETTMQAPISVDTFLGYDVDIARENLKKPGVDTKTAIVSSGKVESDGATVKPVKVAVDSTVEVFLDALAIVAHWLENEPQKAALLKHLNQRDAEKKHKHLDEIKSIVDSQVELAVFAQTFRNVYARTIEKENAQQQENVA